MQGPRSLITSTPAHRRSRTEQPTRRRFLRRAFWLAGGAGVAWATAGAVRFVDVPWLPFLVEPGQIPQPGGEPRVFPDGKFWLVNLRPGDGGSRTVAASRSGGLLALHWRCPHDGTPIRWRSDIAFAGIGRWVDPFVVPNDNGWFRCLRCDSTFTRAGIRVHGPSPEMVKPLPIRPRPDRALLVDTVEFASGVAADEACTHPSVDALQRPLIIDPGVGSRSASDASEALRTVWITAGRI